MRIIPFIFLTMLGSSRALAGPDSTTQWLMNDSVSMLDFGILKIDLALQSEKLGSASYNWDKNRLVITTFLFEAPDGGDYDAAEGEKWCAEWVGKVRSRGGVNLETGKTLGAHSFYAMEFEHSGFNRNNTPEKLIEQIDKMIELECYAFASEPAVTVRAPLIGTSYLLEK